MPGATIALRRGTPADAEMLFAWRAEPSAARFQPLESTSVAALRRQLRERSAAALDRAFTGKAQWIVERGGVPVGWISLVVIDREHDRGAIGYTIGEAFRRQGCATAAVRSLITLAFDPAGPDLGRLEAVAAVANRASQRVLERAGFTREGRARGLLIIAGKRVDHYRYGLLRDDS